MWGNLVYWVRQPIRFFQDSTRNRFFGTAPWEDKSRDIMHFLLHYLPIDPSASADLPLHLPRLPDSVAEERRQRGFANERTLVGLGHSAGATAL
jgi:hypothetical protein